MVTNINLVSTESEKKSLLTGKSTLFLSILLAALVLGAYGAVALVENSYKAKKSRIETEIQAEKVKMTSSEYSNLADFQERIDLLDKIIDNHAYWDEYLKNLSKFVLPDIRFTGISSKGESIFIRGVAPNFETLSRGIMLLQKSPGVSAVEFKSASEKAGSDGQSGLDFDLVMTASKGALNAKSSLSQ